MMMMMMGDDVTTARVVEPVPATDHLGPGRLVKYDYMTATGSKKGAWPRHYHLLTTWDGEVMVRCVYLSDDVSQAGVTQQQPAAWCDAIGFVLELPWIHFMKIFKPADTKVSVWTRLTSFM